MNSASIKKLLKLLLKIGVSAAAIAFVFSKIDITSTFETICSAHWSWLLLALVVYVISQVLSAMRLNSIFTIIPIKISAIANIKLYWLGMFYNFFLPGGVGGDGYKVYYLHKRYRTPIKQLVKIFISDRLSGLVAICIYLIAFISSLGDKFGIEYSIYFSVLIPSAFFCYRIFLHFFARFVMPACNKVMRYSVFIQGLQMFAAINILFSLGESDYIIEYLFLFFISSIASAIPISLGGIGLRELTFVMGSQYLDTNEHIAVSLSILFYAVSLFSSLPGAIFALRTSLIEGKKAETYSCNVSN